MTRLIHMRGDLSGMFLFFIAFFLGLWQVVVAWKRLNGLSLTGRPDRRSVSYVVGLAVMAAACAWYFSGRSHFASPDLEGVETLLVMIGGLVVASVIQGVLAQAFFVALRRLGRRQDAPAGPVDEGEDVSLDLAGDTVPCTFYASSATRRASSVLLLHDYGSSRAQMSALAASLAARGHDTLTVDLDGHASNPRGIEDPAMIDLLKGAVEVLGARSPGARMDAVGSGLGGLLAMELASRGEARRAVAVDPPARDVAGHHDVDALRESGIAAVLSELCRPSARAAGGGRISLSRLVASLPTSRCPAEGDGMITVMGTRKTWFNDPSSLAGFAHECSRFDPLLVNGTHESLSSQEDTAEIVAGILA